jgi:hypothetical protein
VSNTLPSHVGTESANPETGTETETETTIATATASETGNETASTENGIDATMSTTIVNQAIETLVIEDRATCGILESLSTVRENENTGTLGTEICEIHGTYVIFATLEIVILEICAIQEMFEIYVTSVNEIAERHFCHVDPMCVLTHDPIHEPI